MPRTPKRSRRPEEPSPPAADDVSPTGRRRAPSERIPARRGGKDAALETYEQAPERGSEDARLLADETPRDARRDDAA